MVGLKNQATVHSSQISSTYFLNKALQFILTAVCKYMVTNSLIPFIHQSCFSYFMFSDYTRCEDSET